MSDTKSLNTIDCTKYSNSGLWIANNCDVCTKSESDKCPYRFRDFNDHEPYYCPDLERR